MKSILTSIILLLLITMSEEIEVDNQISTGQRSDTLTISQSAAVFFHPDSLRIKELKEERGLEDFYTIADDAMWHVAKAREFLEQQGLETIDTDNRFISFILENGKTTTLKTESLEPIWGLILFDGKKEPFVTYPVDATYDYKRYLKQNENRR